MGEGVGDAFSQRGRIGASPVRPWLGQSLRGDLVQRGFGPGGQRRLHLPHHSPWHVNGAHQGVEGVDGPLIEEAVALSTHVASGHRRRRGSKLAGNAREGVRRHPCDLCHTFRRVVVAHHQSAESYVGLAGLIGPILKTKGVFGNEDLVVQLIADDDVGHAQCQSPLSARSDGEPFVGFGGRHRSAALDLHDLGPHIRTAPSQAAVGSQLPY